MTIISLPEATVRLLGSTQVLTTPTSLIKELIDNSLDAQANSVDVYVSLNTLDKIEVRDNGHGIPREDFDALGKRGHTSKLRSFDELKSIGGISLGFRGEALFSAVQLGKVSITSKSDGEQVATMAKFKAQGGIDTLVNASHPTGTTVCITDFLHSVPVRKQTCLREAPKTLGRIKELFRAYSLARPHVKFSLKTAKDSKGSWSYSPRRNTGIKEAVSQAIGREVAAQCMEKSIIFPEIMQPCNHNFEQPPGAVINCSSLATNQFTIDVFLPKPDADFSKISHGQYISVDARPVSHDKGTMKKITTIFKHYIRSIPLNTTSKIFNPFLRLSIKCPVESYDPNVEPAKDDVLFVNEDLILENIEKVFSDTYSNGQSSGEVSETAKDNISDISGPLLSRESVEFGQIVQPKSPTRKNTQVFFDRSPEGSDNMRLADKSSIIMEKEIFGSQEARQARMVDMSENYTEPVKTPVKQIAQIKHSLSTPESSNEIIDVNSTTFNPWTIAKSNPSKHKIHGNNTCPSLGRRIRRGLPPTPLSSSDPDTEEIENLGSVEKSSHKERHTNHTVNRELFMQDTTDLSVDLCSKENSRSPINDQTSIIGSEDGLFVSEKPSIFSHSRDFVSARHLIDPQELPVSSYVQPEQMKTRDKTFTPQLKKRQKGSQENIDENLIIGNSVSRERHLNAKHNNENQDLIWSMDYEHRKEQATKQLREELRASQPNQLSPHQNRYKAAALALDDNLQLGQQKIQTTLSVPKTKTSIPDDDPRGYFIRRQNSLLHLTGKIDGPKISKAKYLRLPLEKIPSGQELYKNLLSLCTNKNHIIEITKQLQVSDQYIKIGRNNMALTEGLSNLSEKDKESMISSIKLMFEEWKRNFTATDGQEIEFNFDNLIVSKT